MSIDIKKEGRGDLAICCGKTPQMKWILSVSCYCLGYSGSAEDCVFGPNSQRFDKPDGGHHSGRLNLSVNNSPSQDYPHPDDQAARSYVSHCH